METEHLKYYIDKVHIPVFLVVIDTTSKTGWWVFLQHFIKSNLKTNWRHAKQATIHLPTENLVTDPVKLRQAIVDATAYMKELNPSSISAAIAAEKARVESLDDRFDIEVTASKDEISYEINPKSEQLFMFKAQSPHASKKLIQLWEAGGRVNFDDGEIDVEGYPKGLSDGYELIGMGFNTAPVDAMIRLTANDADEQKQFIDLTGTFTHGSKKGEVVASLPNSAISISFPLDPERPNAEMNLSVGFNCWHNQDVRTLSYLDLISKFFEAISNEKFQCGEKSISIEVFLNGNSMMTCDGDQVLTDRLRYFSPIVSVLSKAKVVACALKVAAIAPEMFNALHAHQVQTVYDLWKNGMASFPSPDVTASNKLDDFEYAELFDKFSDPTEFKTYQGGGLPFLDTTIDLGLQSVTFSEMEIDTENTVIQQNGSYVAAFKATQDCVCTLRKCTDKELEELQPYLEQRQHELAQEQEIG